MVPLTVSLPVPKLGRSPVSGSPAASACALLADSIINPEAPLALRLSGQLLLGVVKVYSKKVGYLYQDCNDALQKIKEVRSPSCTRHTPRLEVKTPSLGGYSCELPTDLLH